MRGGRRFTVLVWLCAAVAALVMCAIAPGAGAVPTLTPARTVPMANSAERPAVYTLAPDGTFWVAQGTESPMGIITHLNSTGAVLSEASLFKVFFKPLSIGYYEGRVFVASPSSSNTDDQLYSWPVGSIGTSQPVEADAETEARFGTGQISIRFAAEGKVAATLGESNKVLSFLNGAPIAVFPGEPYYPQDYLGAGINTGFREHTTPFETCHAAANASSGVPIGCGHLDGFEDNVTNGESGFSFPDDIAPAPELEGFFVTEKFGKEHGDSVSFVYTGVGGPVVEKRFGPPGHADGEAEEPLSIVRDPATGYLYISDKGNRRIDVFDSGGNFVAAFGFGVLDGADSFESCGVEIGPCRAGVFFGEDHRSSFSRLDLGPEGDLYAYEPLADLVQVFALGSAAGVGSGPAGDSGAGESTPTGVSTPPAIVTPILAPVTTPIATKPPTLKCKKGSLKKKVKGVERCVKKQAHRKKHQRKHHRSRVL
jgi:DNA-binding beta-propeller fold protein YncE